MQELVAEVPTGGHCVSVTDVKTGTTLYGTTKNNEIKTGNRPEPVEYQFKKMMRARRLLGYAIDIFMHKCYN